MSALDRLSARLVRCRRCPRLARYREQVAGTKRAFAGETYWARPVPGFGDPAARVVLVGLAPAAHGANRTGRMFTGDGTDGMGSSDFLMRALHATGFANRATSRTREDGLRLTDLWMTASVRCVPPDNRPTPAEVARCAAWLEEEFALLPRVRVVVALGKLAFDRVLLQLAGRGAELPSPRPKFAHGAEVHLAAQVHVGADVAVGGGVTIRGAAARPGRAFPVVLASYHPSRQNTQTGRLSPEMLRHVFARAREIAAG